MRAGPVMGGEASTRRAGLAPIVTALWTAARVVPRAHAALSGGRGAAALAARGETPASLGRRAVVGDDDEPEIAGRDARPAVRAGDADSADASRDGGGGHAREVAVEDVVAGRYTGGDIPGDADLGTSGVKPRTGRGVGDRLDRGRRRRADGLVAAARSGERHLDVV